MTVHAHITGDSGQIQRAVGVGMTIVAINHEGLVAVWMTVAGNAFGQSFFVCYPAWGVSVIDLVAEGTYLLVTMALGLQKFENSNMTLSALLHLQRFYSLVIQGWPRRYCFDLSS